MKVTQMTIDDFLDEVVEVVKKKITSDYVEIARSVGLGMNSGKKYREWLKGIHEVMTKPKQEMSRFDKKRYLYDNEFHFFVFNKKTNKMERRLMPEGTKDKIWEYCVDYIPEVKYG